MSERTIETIVFGMIILFAIEGFFGPIQGIIEAWRSKEK